MESTAHASSAGIVYRCSLARRIFAWFVIAWLLVLAELLAAGVLWIGAPVWIWGPNVSAPGWWHGVAAAGLLLVAVFIVRWISRSIPSRLILLDDVIEIGGLIFRRRIPYEGVRIVHLVKHPNVLDRSLELRIQRFRGGQVSIHLPQQNARESFHAIHEMSDATAMDIDDSIYAPVNPAETERGRTDAARVYRQRALRSWVIAAALFAYGCLAIGSLIFWGAPNSGRAWQWAILGPALAVVAAANALRNRRLAADVLTAPTERNVVIQEM